MASLRNWYTGQLVTATEFRDGDTSLEDGALSIITDLGLIGVMSGGGVEEHAGTPNLTVDVASTLARSPLGERIRVVGAQNVSIEYDYLGNPTAVTTPGNFKYVDIYLVFDRVPSDPRLDATNTTVYWVQDEGFGFDVVQGAESLTPSAPPVLADGVLYARVQLAFGQTQVLNENINVDVRDELFRITGPHLEVIAQSIGSALTQIVDRYNSHVDGSLDPHTGVSVAYAGSGAFANGDTLVSSNLQSAIDEVVNKLASILTTSGTHRIGSFAIPSSIGGSTIAAGTLFSILTALRSATNIEVAALASWLGGNANEAATLQVALGRIISDLGSQLNGDDGIKLIGGYAIGGTPDSLATAPLRDMLTSMLTLVNARARKAGSETISGDWTHTRALIMSGANARLRKRTPVQLSDADQIVELSADTHRIPALTASRAYTLRRSTGGASLTPSGGERLTIINRGNNATRTITITSEGSQGTLLTLDGANYAAMTFEFDAGVALGGDGLGAWFLASSPSTGMTLVAPYPVV